MCLYTRQICPRKARKPITVYKIVYKKANGGLITPYKVAKIATNSVIEARGNNIMPHEYYWLQRHLLAPCSSTLLNAFKRNYFEKCKTVSEGYIHCYTTFDRAKEECDEFNIGWFNPPYCIIECIIEPGTLYYKSILGIEMCARSLTTKGIIY